MQHLITIKAAAIGKDTIATCNARDLHEFLESKAQFADWIKDRIEQYGFEEGKDYVTIASENSEAKRGGHNRKDYHLSLDMAKELSMVERTEKGKQARQYFIECERQAKAGARAKISKPQTPLKQLSEATKAFKDVYSLLRTLDFDKNAATISANQAVRQQSELDLLVLTGNTHLKAENQSSRHYTPTELGQQLGGLSAIKVNRLLEQAGLQNKVAGQWQPTAAGRAHAFISDIGKQHSSGAPIQQVRWFDSVLEWINPEQPHRLAA